MLNPGRMWKQHRNRQNALCIYPVPLMDFFFFCVCVEDLKDWAIGYSLNVYNQ